MNSNVAKTALGVVLLAAAVVLFVVLSDDDGGNGMRESTTTVAPTGPTGGGSQAGQPSAPEQPAAPAKPPIPTVSVRNGAPVGGVQEIGVVSGDRMRFRVASDEAGEVHVHGYEITEPVAAGGMITLDFPADLQGGYEVELHSHATGDIPIASLVVNPG